MTKHNDLAAQSTNIPIHTPSTPSPNLNIIKQHEHNLDEVIEQLMKTAIETTEKIIVK